MRSKKESAAPSVEPSPTLAERAAELQADAAFEKHPSVKRVHEIIDEAHRIADDAEKLRTNRTALMDLSLVEKRAFFEEVMKVKDMALSARRVAQSELEKLAPMEQIHSTAVSLENELTGKKKHPNEDAFCADDKSGVYGVFDGMGGYEGSEKAAKAGADFFQKHGRELLGLDLEHAKQALQNLFNEAGGEVKRERGRKEMYTTASVVKIWEGDGKRKALVANAGDSRVCVLRKNGDLETVTIDHTPVLDTIELQWGDMEKNTALRFQNILDKISPPRNWELRFRRGDILEKKDLRDMGLNKEDIDFVEDHGFSAEILAYFFDPEKARNTVTNDLENATETTTDIIEVDLEEGDEIFIMSDGPSDNLPHKIMRSIAGGRYDEVEDEEIRDALKPEMEPAEALAVAGRVFARREDLKTEERPKRDDMTVVHVRPQGAIKEKPSAIEAA